MNIYTPGEGGLLVIYMYRASTVRYMYVYRAERAVGELRGDQRRQLGARLCLVPDVQRLTVTST